MPDERYNEYLRSETWQRLRSERLKIDGYKCQRCGRPFDLQVHHLYYPPDLGTEDVHRDLITLCDSCHEEVEHQKKAFRFDQQKAWMQKKAYDLRRIKRTIRKLSCNDLSAIGIGTRDYCNIDIIRADFGPELDDCDLSLGYVSRVQDYFRNRRYQIILKFMEDGLTRQEVIARTKFSSNMVHKVFDRPENARTLLKLEKESENND